MHAPDALLRGTLLLNFGHGAFGEYFAENDGGTVFGGKSFTEQGLPEREYIGQDVKPMICAVRVLVEF